MSTVEGLFGEFSVVEQLQSSEDAFVLVDCGDGADELEATLRSVMGFEGRMTVEEGAL